MANIQQSVSGTLEQGAVSNPHYYIGDHLGTTQMEFSSGGWPVWKGEFAPFGQELVYEATENRYKYTGKERDTESGLDYFGARYYSSNMGRFSSPDPSGLMYANPYNPQSLNLYAYAYNNPLINIDPTGLECVWDDGSYDSNDDSSTGTGKVDGSGNHTGCSGQGGT